MMCSGTRLWVNAAFLAALAGAAFSGDLAANAATVAYWRFEDGPANTDVNHIAGAGNTFSADILDVSGNGNHLSTWITGGCCGYAYRSDVPFSTVPQTGAANNFSVKNTGGGPGMFTDSAVSAPSGVNIETMMPSAFTVEASWKPEVGNHRTVVGRDARNVATSDPNLAALYLQAQPDNSLAIKFTDVAGNFHQAVTGPNFVQGYNFGNDPEGLQGTWYKIAGVSDGSTLKLYVNGVLEASAPIVSADPRLAIGSTSGGDWHAGAWTVGRGLYGGGHGDRAYGFIDEVRISDMALLPSQLLQNQVPEPACFVLVVMAGGLVGAVRRRRP
jgi:concanavalin A-like lectin/glucanase superfamily protein